MLGDVIMEKEKVEYKKGSELLEKARLLMALEGYERESLHEGETSMDLRVSKPDSDETVMIHIVTKTDLKSNAIGVDRVREAKRILEEDDVDKVILFGERFTSAAKKELKEEGIEFFAKDQKVVATSNPQELYIKIRECVDGLCNVKCGSIPKSESECEGLSKDLFALRTHVFGRCVEVVDSRLCSIEHHADAFLGIVYILEAHTPETEYGNLFSSLAVIAIMHGGVPVLS